MNNNYTKTVCKISNYRTVGNLLVKRVHTHTTLWRWVFAVFIICWLIFGNLLSQAATTYAATNINYIGLKNTANNQLKHKALVTATTTLQYAPAANYQVGSQPFTSVAGDFNRDGKLDLLVTNNGDNTASLLTGNGDGTFQVAKTIPLGGIPSEIVAGDFNGDGKLDFVTANYHSSNISLVFGNGDGTFQAPITYSMSNMPPGGIVAGDFNGDGKLDFAVSDHDNSSIIIFLNNGNGTFHQSNPYSVGNTPLGLTVGDFNRDGKLDIAVVSFGYGYVSVLLGNGDGTFQPQTPFSVGANPAFVTTADINSDGSLDLVVDNIGSNSVSVLLGKGDGTFTTKSQIPANYDPTSVAVADVNNDGKLDLVVANSGANIVSILVGDGSGNFQSPITYTVGTQPFKVLVADLNGDGKQDIVAPNVGSNNVSILLNISQPYNLLSSNTTLTSSTTPSIVGQNVTFTATLSPANATGTVSFTFGTTAVSSNVVSGVATYVTKTLPVGSTIVTATYSGDNSYFPSTSNTVTQTVNPAISNITVNSSANPSTYGQPVTFTAAIAISNSQQARATVDNTVSFMIDGNTVATELPVINNTATYVTSTLSVGSHSVVASYTGNATANPSTSQVFTQTVNPAPITSTTYTYYLPFVANNADNFTTYLAFQNIGSATANANITYFDSNGNVLSAATVVTTVAQYAEVIPNNPFATGASGAGIITSTQPLNVIVPEATPYGGSAYAVNSGSSNSLIAPFALNNAFGDFTTQLNIFNGGSTPVTATVTFYGTIDGNSTTITSSTSSVKVGAHQAANLNQNTLPSGFSGWAQITGSANTLVAQVLEQSPSTKFVAIANAIANPSTTEYAPAIFDGGYGSFYTGANIVNPNSNSVTVTVTYYDLSAGMTTTTPFAIPAYGVVSIFDGATSSGKGLPSGGLPKNFIGSMAVSSVGGPVAMSVNENGGVTSAGNSRSGTYAAIASGGSTVGLPVVSNGGFTYTTGDTILNTSSQSVTGTISYYNTDGTPVGVSKTFTIAGHGSEAYYQGDGSLTSGFYGTAVITETSGPANSLVVTTNAQNIALFYTYSEPNS